MKCSRTIAHLLLSAVVGFAPTAMQAQKAGPFLFTPYVGVYAPSSDVFRLAIAENGTTIAFRTRHQLAVAVGATVSVRLDDRFSIEAGELYSPSTLQSDLRTNQFGIASASSGSDQSNVWATTAKLVVRALPAEGKLNLDVGVGPALVTRGGAAYRPGDIGRMTGLTNGGAALSLGTRIGLGRLGDLRLRAEDVVYQTKQRWETGVKFAPELQSDSRLQHDVVVSIGWQLGATR